MCTQHLQEVQLLQRDRMTCYVSQGMGVSNSTSVPLQLYLYHAPLTRYYLDMAYLCTKIDHPSFSRSKDG